MPWALTLTRREADALPAFHETVQRPLVEVTWTVRSVTQLAPILRCTWTSVPLPGRAVPPTFTVAPGTTCVWSSDSEVVACTLRGSQRDAAAMRALVPSATT